MLKICSTWNLILSKGLRKGSLYRAKQTRAEVVTKNFYQITQNIKAVLPTYLSHHIFGCYMVVKEEETWKQKPEISGDSHPFCLQAPSFAEHYLPVAWSPCGPCSQVNTVCMIYKIAYFPFVVQIKRPSDSILLWKECLSSRDQTIPNVGKALRGTQITSKTSMKICVEAS